MSVEKIGVDFKHLKRKLLDKVYKSQGGYMLDVMFGAVVAALIIVIILWTYNTAQNSAKASNANTDIATIKAQATAIYMAGGKPGSILDLLSYSTAPWKGSDYSFKDNNGVNYTIGLTGAPQSNCNAIAAYWLPFSVNGTNSSCEGDKLVLTMNP